MSDDVLILIVGSFVTSMALWAVVVYFMLLFRERYAQVDPDEVETLRQPTN